MASPEHLVWIDCEMTGLDPVSDALVEIACLVTDGDLNVLGDGIDIVIKPPPEALEGMGDFVRDMHTTSGLLPLLNQGTTLEDAQARLLAYVGEHAAQGKAPLAGNTVGMDRVFLERYMPELTAWLHYRVVDVSSIKELARRWYPRTYFAAPVKTGGHRALGDIRDSILELQYYRATVFAELPGPDTDAARAAAARVVATAAGGPAEPDEVPTAP